MGTTATGGPGCCAAARTGPETSGVRPPAVTPAAPDIAWHRQSVALPGGSFLMGGADADANPEDAEGPVREMTVAPFVIDRYAVSTARFAGFIAATGYVTEAERYGWSFVFAGFLPGPVRKVARRAAGTPWWCAVAGADWWHPQGPQSTAEDRWDHPVVHVSWNDATAFSAWDGARLPSEAEWEYAARGGLVQRRFPWGDELTPGGQHRCNVWQGRFPASNSAEDGYRGTAPVNTYEPNGFGLYNVTGNVWQWTAGDWAPGSGAKAMRGGSYLCHDSYCNRYRVAARSSNTPDSSSGNIGFRTVRR
jgi:formylglycine-generating enzyme required for sulfatase activity